MSRERDRDGRHDLAVRVMSCSMGQLIGMTEWLFPAVGEPDGVDLSDHGLESLR